MTHTTSGCQPLVSWPCGGNKRNGCHESETLAVRALRFWLAVISTVELA
jgi:hypothetical protein